MILGPLSDFRMYALVHLRESHLPRLPDSTDPLSILVSRRHCQGASWSGAPAPRAQYGVLYLMQLVKSLHRKSKSACPFRSIAREATDQPAKI